MRNLLAIALLVPVVFVGIGSAPMAARAHSDRAHVGVRTVSVGDNPIAVAVDTRSGHAFVTALGPLDSYGDPMTTGEVIMIATGSGRVMRRIEVGWAPRAIVVNEHSRRVFVANTSAHTVSMLDTDSGSLLRTMNVDVGPCALAIDPVANRVLVVNSGVTDSLGNPIGPGSISILDATSGSMKGTIELDAAPGAIAIDRRNGRAIVVSYGRTPHTGNLSVIDVRAIRVVRTLALTMLPSGVVVDESLGRAFVAGNSVDGTVSMLDMGTATLLRSVPVQQGAGAVAVDERTGHVFVMGTGYPATSTMLDARTGALLRTSSIGTTAEALAIDGSSGQVFVANRDDGTVSVLSAVSGVPLTTVVVGAGPVAVATACGRAIVVNSGDESVSILSSIGGGQERC